MFCPLSYNLAKHKTEASTLFNQHGVEIFWCHAFLYPSQCPPRDLLLIYPPRHVPRRRDVNKWLRRKKTNAKEEIVDDSDLPSIDKRWLRSSKNGNQFDKQVSRRRQFRSSTNAIVDFDGENMREEEKRKKNKKKKNIIWDLFSCWHVCSSFP